MRLVLAAAVALSLAGAAHAQFAPSKPPRDPFGQPQAEAPRTGVAPIAPIRPIAPIESPKAQGFMPFQPYKPYRGVNPDETPSGLYPELHRHRKPKAEGGF